MTPTQQADVFKSDEDKKGDDDSEDEDTEEDPDFMQQVFNTDSSVQKIGYLFSSQSATDPDQIYSITYTNGLFVWDLNTHDLVYRSPKESQSKVDLSVECDEAEENYFIDCFYYNNVLTTCMSDKRGDLNMYQKDRLFCGTDRGIAGNRTHRDIIRDSYWNGEQLFTCGEDGFLLKWNICESEESEERNVLNKKKQSYAVDSDEEVKRKTRRVDKKFKHSKSFNKN